MKTSNLFSTFLLLLFCQSLAFGQMSSKTLVKSFNLQGLQTIDLQLDGHVEIQEWDNDIVRIQMTITSDNMAESTLKSLIKAGRYNIKSVEEKDAVKIYLPGVEREIRIKGTPINDDITYIINVPSSIFVKQADDTAAAFEQKPK